MAKSDAPLVRLEHLRKQFGSVRAVDGLHLDIVAGEFITFLGPSGCGKSTTLRLLGGFERPDDGRIVIDGEDVTPLPPNRRDVNMVFQDYALFPHMTVAGNVAFGLELKGRTRGEIQRRVGELLDFLQLGELGDRRPEQLSGGQRQRVALARALAPDPKLLLLDEPLGALDAKLRAQVQVELKDIQRRTGKTFFFVTHDQEEALTMSDRIVVMNEGRVEQDGTPEALYFRPATRFVAGFIGETNLLEGSVLGIEGGELVIDFGGHRLRGRAPDGTPPPVGAAVTGALRPERLRCHASPPDDVANVLRGRIEQRIFKGSRQVLGVRVGEHLLTTYQDPEVAGLEHGADAWLSFAAASLAVLP